MISRSASRSIVRGARHPLAAVRSAREYADHRPSDGPKMSDRGGSRAVAPGRIPSETAPGCEASPSSQPRSIPSSIHASALWQYICAELSNAIIKVVWSTNPSLLARILPPGDDTDKGAGGFIGSVEIVQIPFDHYFDPKHPGDFTKIIRGPQAERLFRPERGLPFEPHPLQIEHEPQPEPEPEPVGMTAEELAEHDATVTRLRPQR